MWAQKAAVEPLPFDPVMATDLSCNRTRSMASSVSSSVIRARQTPVPCFDRSNIYQSAGGKRVSPDLQDQIGPLQLFQQADGGIGIDFDDPDRILVAISIAKQ